VRDRKKGIFGYKRFLVPVIKPVCSSFMMSSVLQKIAMREEVVPVPFHHNIHLIHQHVVSLFLPGCLRNARTSQDSLSHDGVGN
jgi:hypothetical protein